MLVRPLQVAPRVQTRPINLTRMVESVGPAVLASTGRCGLGRVLTALLKLFDDRSLSSGRMISFGSARTGIGFSPVQKPGWSHLWQRFDFQHRLSNVLPLL